MSKKMRSDRVSPDQCRFVVCPANAKHDSLYCATHQKEMLRRNGRSTTNARESVRPPNPRAAFQPTYHDGFEAGKAEGYQAGRADGYGVGKADGYKSGKADGLREGFDLGIGAAVAAPAEPDVGDLSERDLRWLLRLAHPDVNPRDEDRATRIAVWLNELHGRAGRRAS